MKAKTYLLTFFAVICSLGLVSAADYADRSDIPSWAIDAVDTVRGNQIMTGFGDGTFQPNKNLNRAEVLTLIFRTKDIDTSEVLDHESSPFPDVRKGAWFEKAVIYATQNDWVRGFPDGNFYPEKELNRAEFAVLLQRVFEFNYKMKEIPRISDLNQRSWYREAAISLYENNLIRNDRALKFFPENKVSRADAAWVFAQISTKPGLLNAAKIKKAEEAAVPFSRKVAIKPRNFDPDKQGYDIEKNGVYVQAYDKGEVSMNISSDWSEMGNVIIKNTLSDQVTLDNIKFNIHFDSNSVGPARNFYLKMINEEGETKELDFQRNGDAIINGWGINLKKDEEFKLKILIKPENVTTYYPSSGKGTLYLNELNATAIAEYTEGEQVGTGRVNYKKAPVVYKSHNLSDLIFTPRVD